jgi:tripartite-type tricarboxylate transporter receptor subunit TctC
MGLEPVPSNSPESVTAFVKSEVDRWAPVVKSLGLKVD